MPSSAQQKEFINNIGYIIQEEAKARGYQVCSPIIAQACLESNYGVSQLSARWNNFFGMKCGSAWKGQSVNLATKEEYNSQLVNIRDNFRVYPSMEEGVKGYFDFISTNRYANLKKATTPKQYLENIKSDGYATSSSYVSSCMGIINRHDLERFDEGGAVAPIGNPYKRTDNIMKSGSRGESVKWLQYVLCEKGYDLKIDGIYGPKTTEAVRDFQTKVFVDGIVGPLTLEKLS
jgi:flagellum-specific peptidoglycan hydrolase FlgJ